MWVWTAWTSLCSCKVSWGGLGVSQCWLHSYLWAKWRRGPYAKLSSGVSDWDPLLRTSTCRTGAEDWVPCDDSSKPNGSRGILTQWQNWVLEVELLTGQHAGSRVFIPHIANQPTEDQVAFKFTRKQFPVWLCFAMSINKSQGQSVKHVGLDLRSPMFTWAVLCWCLKGDILAEHQGDLGWEREGGKNKKHSI